MFSEKPTRAERFDIETLGKMVFGKSKLMEELADINMNKEELVARENKNNQSQVSAVVIAGQYDFVNGVLPIEVSEVEGLSEDMQSLSLAVWTEEGQTDLQWVPLELGEDGVYRARINIPGFGYKTGEYQIQAYAAGGEGEVYFVGQTIGIVN